MSSVVRRTVIAAALAGVFAASPAALAGGGRLAQQAGASQPSLLEQMRTEARTAIAAAVAAGRPDEALDTYDRFFTSVKKHDLVLLAPAVRGVLAQIGNDQGALARMPALERLARSGDAAGRSALEAAAGGRNTLMPDGIEPDCALARLGDQAAVDRLTRRLSDELPRDKSAIIGGLVDAGASRAASAIVPFLTDDNPSNRLAAIQAIGRIGTREHVPPLRAAFEAETHPGTRQAMAAALYSLGSSAGGALLAQVERSPIPDVQLAALEAYYASKSPAWPALARQLLRSSSEGARLRAAALLGLSDADALRELMRAAGSTNMATREVGLRLLESAGYHDTAFLLKFLRDPSPFARVYAGGALLRAPK